MTDNLIIKNLTYSYLKVFFFLLKLNTFLEKVKDSISSAQPNDHIT